MSAVEFFVERLEEEDVEPTLDKRIVRLVCGTVALPERPQKAGIAAEPTFALDEVEEHAAVEEL